MYIKLCQMNGVCSWCLEFIFWVSVCHTWVILTGSAFCKTNELSFPLWKHANAINLPPGSWLLTLGNGAMPELASAVSRLGTQQWLQPGQLCELKHMSPCLRILCIPATMAILLMNILDNDRSGWGNKSASIYRTDAFKHSYNNSTSADHLYSHKYFLLDTFSDTFTYLSFFPLTVLQQLSTHTHSKSDTIVISYLYPIIGVYHVTLAKLFLDTTQHTRVKQIWISYGLSDSSKMGLSCHTLTFYSGAWISHRVICRTQSQDLIWS